MDTDPLAALWLALQRWGSKAEQRPEFELQEITLSQITELLKQLGNSRTYGS